MKINIELEVGIESGLVVGGLTALLTDLEFLGKTDCDLYKVAKNLQDKINIKVIESMFPRES